MIAVIELSDEAATAALGVRLSRIARRGDIIALKGDLGAGKTTLARAFIRALGEGGEVPSPTFTLVQIYEVGSVPVWHFDLYRLTAAEEAWELGIEEAFTSGIALIEWPERLGGLLPQRHLAIALEFGRQPEERRAVVSGEATWHARLAEIAADA